MTALQFTRTTHHGRGAVVPPITSFPLPAGLARVVLLADIENLAIALERFAYALSENLLLAFLKMHCTSPQVWAFCAEDSLGDYRTEVSQDGVMVKHIKPGRSYGYDTDVDMAIAATTKLPTDTDGVIIGSGDKHMLPLILFLKKRGVHVGVLSVPASTSSVLRKFAGVEHSLVGRDLLVTAKSLGLWE